eukprot:TRINITY_DN3193_c0_g1_i2.p1 TRINITY_DN3193_c0_g1~~TRINITY_DN3193_c0_g1_i2.p1  ORF type:complete len:806 (-),score=109.49 TRINITY_DN3193_c0_g1_i2:787-3204(-)
MASVTELQETEALLGQMLVPNTETVRAAVAELNNRLKRPAFYSLLLQLLHQHPLEQIRQLVAVLLRTKIVDMWNHLSEEFHVALKNVLLEGLVKEPSKLVRHSIAEVIGIVARISVPLGQWPNVLDFLFQCTQSENPGHREVAMKLFDTLTDHIGDHFRSHTATLFQIFARGLADPELSVRVASLRAVGSLVEWVTTEEEITTFGEFIPHMIFVLGQVLQSDMQDDASRAFEMFYDLIESPVPVIVPYIPIVAKAMLEIGVNQSIDMGLRQMALTAVQWMASYKPKLLVKHQLVDMCIQAALALTMEAGEGEEADDDEDDDGLYLSNHEFGSQMIEHLAHMLTYKRVWAPCLEYAQKFGASTSPLQRRAALDVLGVLADPCYEQMVESLEPLLQFVVRGFADPDRRVREAALLCLAQFSKHLQPEILRYHGDILPLILNALDTSVAEGAVSTPGDDKLRVKACYALDALCHNLGEQVVPHLPVIVGKLLSLLRRSDSEVQELAMSAMSAIVEAAGDAFIPFFMEILQYIKVIMAQENDEYLILRCRATECAGVLALAVKKENIIAHVPELMTLACAGMKLEFCELREYTYGFFTHIAECIGPDFQSYLPAVMELALHSCLSSDGVVYYDGEEQGTVEGIQQLKTLNPINVSMPQSFLDEKAAASHAIGSLAKHTGAAFFPYVNKSIETMGEMASFNYIDARQNALASMAEIVVAAHTATTQGAPATALHPETQKILEAVVAGLEEAMEHDVSRSVCAAACESAGMLAQGLGLLFLPYYLNTIIPTIKRVLRYKTSCQKKPCRRVC